MAPSQMDYDDLMLTSSLRTYTLTEALDFEEMVSRNYPTNKPIRWVNSKTGNLVSIGRTGGSMTLKKRQEIMDKKKGKGKKDSRHNFCKDDHRQNKYRARRAR